MQHKRRVKVASICLTVATMASVGLAVGIQLAISSASCAPAWAENKQVVSSSKNLAGTYYAGDGLGFNNTIVITADGHFTHNWSGCMGTYSKSSGKVSFADGVITFQPEAADEKCPSTLVPTKWGERLYLVDSLKFLDFCNDINQEREPRKTKHGMSYMKVDDEKKAVSSIPDLPQEWRSFVLTKPVTGKIVRMIDARQTELNVGAVDGLKKGMVLTARDDNACNQVRVVEVNPRSCVAVADMTIRGSLAKGQGVFSSFFKP